jgi:hypothetical protein
MPLLGGLMLTLFAGLLDFFVKFFTRDVALRLAFGALMVASFVVLYGAAVGLMSAIAVTMPSFLVSAIAFAFPSNVSGCLAAALGADAACMGYRLYVVGLGGRS